MRTNPDGTIYYEDSTKARWGIVCADVPADWILWTPKSVDRLERYIDSSSEFGPVDQRRASFFMSTVFAYAPEQEVVIHIPQNRPVPIRRMVILPPVSEE